MICKQIPHIQSSSTFQMGFDLSPMLRAGSLDLKIPVAFFSKEARRDEGKTNQERKEFTLNPKQLVTFLEYNV